MKIFKYIALSASLLALNSCDFLDKDPYNLTPETYFNDEAELNKVLTGVYSPLMQEQFYGENYPSYLVGGDDLSFYQRSAPKVGICCATASSSTPEIMMFWRILYEGINRANVLLENVDNVSFLSGEKRARMKAEGYFLRAFYYFHLIQCWGDVPLVLQSTKTVEHLSIPRTDKQVVYDLIIKDIEDNIKYLPTELEVMTPERISQTAAQGILARIYLFRAGEHYRDGKPAGPEVETYFERAAYWANEVKKSGLHDLVKPYSRVFQDLAEDKYNSTGVRESMWEVAEAGNRINDVEFSAGKIGSVYGFGCGTDFSANADYKAKKGMENPGYANKSFFASLKLYEMYYEEDPDNIDRERGDWNIAPYEYKMDAGKVAGREYYYPLKPAGLNSVDGFPCTQLEQSKSTNKVRCLAKYRREHEQVLPKSKYYTPINFPVLRYSDVLLMLAEAENEVHHGPTPLAFECINAVRERAGLNRLWENLDQYEFREIIKKERAMELCFEALRRWDLIRWGDFYSTMRSMESYVAKDGWAQTYKYASTYYKVTPAYVYFPIPDWEMSVNDQMKQNPDW